jgi:hypothetical protein
MRRRVGHSGSRQPSDWDRRRFDEWILEDVAASSKDTPCLVTLATAFRGSQLNIKTPAKPKHIEPLIWHGLEGSILNGSRHSRAYGTARLDDQETSPGGVSWLKANSSAARDRAWLGRSRSSLGEQNVPDRLVVASDLAIRGRSIYEQFDSFQCLGVLGVQTALALVLGGTCEPSHPTGTLILVLAIRGNSDHRRYGS